MRTIAFFFVALVFAVGSVPSFALQVNAPAELTASKSKERATTLSSASLVKSPLKKVQEEARVTTADFLPQTSTRGWISFRDINSLEEKLAKSDLGVLGKQESIRPFLESMQDQLKELLKKNNIQFGVEIESLPDLETGEICIAGILPEVAGAKPSRGSHGIVVLVDVSKDVEKARELISVASSKATDRGAKLETMDINGTQVEKLVFEPKGNRVRRKRQSLASISDGWLLASDNEAIFREILSNINKLKNDQTINSFGNQKSFKVISERTSTEGVVADIKWFVDPIGYARFADVLAQENRAVKQIKAQPIETMANAGLDAIRAAGGAFSFATEEHEILYRGMIYGPRDQALKPGQKRVFDLLDFTDIPARLDQPPSWVAEDASSYFSGTWGLEKAFANIGHFIDAQAGEPGTWDSVLEKMKTVPKFKVNLKEMVSKLDNQFTVFTVAEEPITLNSEKVVIGLRLKPGMSKEDSDWLLESIGRAVQGKVKVLGGFKTIEDDPSQVEDELPDPLGDGFDDLVDDFGSEAEEEEKAKPDPTIFSRRYFAIKDGYILICNDKDYLKKLLISKGAGKFGKKEDLIEMRAALDKLTDKSRVRFSQFGRLDRILKPNYEMLRRGEMAASQTMFARFLNRAMSTDDDPTVERKQKIDGSKLPSDFDGEVAPYLGTAGWVMEIEDNGWRFTGCVVKKKRDEKPVKK